MTSTLKSSMDFPITKKNESRLEDVTESPFILVDGPKTKATFFT